MAYANVRRYEGRMTPLELMLKDSDVWDQLRARIHVNIALVMHMAKHLELEDEETLKHEMTINCKKVDYLISLVISKGLKTYKALCSALEETSQPGALDILRAAEKRFNFDGHEDIAVDTSRNTNNTKKIWSIRDLTYSDKSAIQELQQSLAEFYVQLNQKHQIMKGLRDYTQFTNDLTSQYTELQLEKDEQSIWKKNTSTTLVTALEGQEKNYLFTGPAGVGKSSALLQVTLLWVEYLEKQTQELHATCIADKKMVVFLRPSQCVDSLNDSVRQTLIMACGDDDIESLMEFFHTHKKSTAVIIESLDEIHHLENLIKDIEREMRNQKRTFIVAARSFHPVKEKFSEMVSLQRVKVIGFDDSKICEFISKTLSSKPVASSKLQDIVSTDEKMRVLLKNPLILVLVCLLIHQESVSVETLSCFSKFQIFEAIENMLIRREKITVSLMNQFHELVLISLLDEKVIYKSNIDEICPQLVDLSYLKAENIKDPLEAWRGQVIAWSHIAFQEYGAAKALNECSLVVRNGLVTLIASRRRLNYVLGFTVAMMQISKTDIKHLINTILATQINLDVTEGNRKKEKKIGNRENCLCKRNRQIREELGQMSASHICHDESIPMDFDFTTIIPCRDCFKSKGILASGAGQAVLQNCFDMLSQLQGDRSDVFTEIMAPLLPAIWTGPANTVTIIPISCHARCAYVEDYFNNRNDFGSRIVRTADYKDIVEARILHSPRLVDLYHKTEWLYIDINITGHTYTNIYGTVVLPPDHETYSSLLTYLPQSPALVGHGWMILLQNPSQSWSPFFRQLPEHITKLWDWGLRQLWTQKGCCTLQEVKELLSQIRGQGWQVMPGNVEVRLRKESKEMFLTLWMPDIKSYEDQEQRQEVESTGIFRDPNWT